MKARAYRRVLAVVLALSMAMSLLGMTTLAADPGEVTLTVGETQTLTGGSTVSGGELTEEVDSWTNSDPTVVELDEATGEVTGLAAGTATITHESAVWEYIPGDSSDDGDVYQLDDVAAGHEGWVAVTTTWTVTVEDDDEDQSGYEPIPDPIRWDISKSKEATELDENWESRVTLSLPAAELRTDLDVVFVLDGSTSADKAELAAAAAGMLDTLNGYKNLNVKVGIVIFGGSVPILENIPLTALNDGSCENLKNILMDDKYDGFEGRRGSNLQAGVQAGQALLESGSADSENQYLILLSDGGARMWLNDAGQAVAQLYVMYNWNTTEDFRARYVSGSLPLRTFGQLMNEAEEGHVIGGYAVTEAGSTDPANVVSGKVDCANDPYFYSNVESGTYYAGRAIMDASTQAHVIWLTYNWTTSGSEEETYAESFRSWICGRGYATRYDVEAVTDYAAVLSDVTDQVVQLVDAGSRVVDVIGNDVDANGVAYDFDFVNDASHLKLTVGGTVLETVQLDENTYGFRMPGAADYAFTLTYYPDGEDGASEECFVWDILVAVTKNAPVQLTYTVRLTNPQETAGTYGSYDRFGDDNNGSSRYGLYTNNSATLYPVDSNGSHGAKEEFQKPTVEYTVEKEPGEEPGEEPEQPGGTEKPSVNPNPGGNDTDIPDDSAPTTELPETEATPAEEIPAEELPEEDVPLAELPEEDVPMAEVPETGDASGLLALCAVLSGLGLAVLANSKRKEEI